MEIKVEIRDICEAFRDGLKGILGGKLFGVYIYGAAAFQEAFPIGDIDFHVILKEVLTEKEQAALKELHRSLARRFPPLGAEFDGYYILLDDARGKTPPGSQMWNRATDESWALHRAHMLAGRCIVLYGPEPEEIYIPPEWPEIEEALFSELAFVEKHLHNYPDYCILNLCRLIYSFETRDVVISKGKAAEWAYEKLPGWRRHIELARKSYARQGTPEEREFMLAEIERFYDFAWERIKRSQGS